MALLSVCCHAELPGSRLLLLKLSRSCLGESYCPRHLHCVLYRTYWVPCKCIRYLASCKSCMRVVLRRNESCADGKPHTALNQSSGQRLFNQRDLQREQPSSEDILESLQTWNLLMKLVDHLRVPCVSPGWAYQSTGPSRLAQNNVDSDKQLSVPKVK